MTDEAPQDIALVVHRFCGKSKKQATVVLSTCKAEYTALATTTQESLSLIQLLNGMEKNCQYAPVKIFEDNQGTLTLSKDPVCCQTCKHVDIVILFVQQLLMGKL